MKKNIKKLPALPNPGYVTCANWSCVIDNKILFGGGSGFINPLAKGGSKVLDNTIWLLDFVKNKWIIIAKHQLKIKGKNYGFCNGVSLKISNNKTVYIGGFKQVNNIISNSSDILICEWKNNKLNFKIFENVLPISGEMIGAINDQMIACVSGSDNKIVLIDFKSDSTLKPFKIIKTHIEKTFNINGAQISWNPIDKKWLFFGGYVSFNKNDISNSNYFNLNQVLAFDNDNFVAFKLANFRKNPLTYLGSSILLDENFYNLLLIGGVNKTKFTKAVYQLSTLKNEKLIRYKQKYFNFSFKYFNFNNRLTLINLKSKTLKTLLILPFGLAGNPNFIKWKNSFYILSGELKPGVRLKEPLKII